MSLTGQFLPRHLTERAAALPHTAAAPTVRYRGSYGPAADTIPIFDILSYRALMGLPTNAKSFFWIGGGLLGCLIVFYFIFDDPRTIFVRWRDFSNLTVSVKGDLEVANDGWLWRRASLRLICSSTGSLHLLLRARMPGPQDFLQPGSDGAVELVVGDKGLRLNERIKLIDMGPVDTLATTELSAAELNDLATLFRPTTPQSIAFMTMERGVYLVGVPDEASIRNFIEHCSSNK